VVKVSNEQFRGTAISCCGKESHGSQSLFVIYADQQTWVRGQQVRRSFIHKKLYFLRTLSIGRCLVGRCANRLGRNPLWTGARESICSAAHFPTDRHIRKCIRLTKILLWHCQDSRGGHESLPHQTLRILILSDGARGRRRTFNFLISTVFVHRTIGDQLRKKIYQAANVFLHVEAFLEALRGARFHRSTLGSI